MQHLQDGQVRTLLLCRIRWYGTGRAEFASIPLHPAISGNLTALKSYFDHQASKYGTTVDQIYQAAANSDLKHCQPKTRGGLKRFFSWSIRSGITRQTLDVNCGSTTRN